jgi:hypothetical protein
MVSICSAPYLKPVGSILDPKIFLDLLDESLAEFFIRSVIGHLCLPAVPQNGQMSAASFVRLKRTAVLSEESAKLSGAHSDLVTDLFQTSREL